MHPKLFGFLHSSSSNHEEQIVISLPDQDMNDFTRLHHSLLSRINEVELKTEAEVELKDDYSPEDHDFHSDTENNPNEEGQTIQISLVKKPKKEKIVRKKRLKMMKRRKKTFRKVLLLKLHLETHTFYHSLV